MRDREQLEKLACRAQLTTTQPCQFCGDGDFDLPGLRNHIFTQCQVVIAASKADDNFGVAQVLRSWTHRITREELDAGRTPKGQWTAKQLAEWGVPWPPPKGWIERLVR